MCTYMAILIFFTLTATGKGGARRYRFSKRQIIDKFRYGLVDNVTNFSLHFFFKFQAHDICACGICAQWLKNIFKALPTCP